MFDAKTIRQIPLYIRWRYRTVYEALKESRMRLAVENKAWFVFDFAK